MIKKQVAIFFILLANIILLAHAAVPHHHHKTQVCIESTHCQNYSKPHNASHNHQHDGENGSNYCLLKQLVVLPSNQDKQEFKYSFLTDRHSMWDGYQTVLLNHEFQYCIATLILNSDISSNTSPYIFFINSSLGLRAPPTV